MEQNTTRSRRMANNPAWRSWRAMVHRCNCVSASCYRNYGGRGIRVCERWQGRDGFVNFLADMGQRPPGHSIDRIDNNGNYEPGNCRWATTSQQASNRRPYGHNRKQGQLIEFNGESLTAEEWSVRLGGGHGLVWSRLKSGWSVEKAITTPPDRRFNWRKKAA